MFFSGYASMVMLAKDAAEKGDLATIKRLVEQQGFDVLTDIDGCAWTMAHAVALNKKWDCLRYLVGRDQWLTRETSLLGTTVLHRAVRSGCSTSVAKFLVKNGADPRAEDTEGTVLHCAGSEIGGPRKELVQYFLQLGIPDPSIKSREGLTALHMAVYGYNLDVLKVLVQSEKVNIDIQEENGHTLLHLSSRFGGRTSILLYLLRESNACINIRNKNKKTALEDSDPGSEERLLLLAADLGRSPIKSKDMRKKKKRELSELLSRHFQQPNTEKLDPVDIIDFMVKENILDKELISLAQAFFNQVFQQALSSANLDCMQMLINGAMIHQDDPEWAPLKQDKEGRSKIWSSVHQRRQDNLGTIKDQLGTNAYLSGLVGHQIVNGDPSLLRLACERSSEDMVDILILMLEKCSSKFQRISGKNVAEVLIAAHHSNNLMVEKLLRTKLFQKKEAIKFCEDFGYAELMHKYVCSPLLVLTATHSLLSKNSMSDLELLGNKDPVLSQKFQRFKDNIAACSAKKEAKKDKSIVYINQILEKNVRCTRHLGKKRANCAFELIQTVQRFQESLNKPTSPFFQLKPRFKMTGPMTGIDCVDMANNLNISIEFENLRPEDFSLTDGAMTLMSAKRGQELMSLWTAEDNSIDMQKLLRALLSSFKDFLRENCHTLPAWMDLVHTQVEWSNCGTCLDHNL